MWLANGHSFQVLLDRYVGELRGLRVLEVGAAKAWAARYWLERGCEFVATDILVDPKIGLGRGAFYGDFGRVQADGEHLPFADASFDVAYCVATLHHALDLKQMVREMSRVARPGAVVAGLNEGTRGVRETRRTPTRRPRRRSGSTSTCTRSGRTSPRSHRRACACAASSGPTAGAPSPYGRLLSRIPKIGLDARHDRAPERRARYCGVSIYARKPAMSVYADCFRYRELFGNLFRRDLQAKYRGSALGVAVDDREPDAADGRLPARLQRRAQGPLRQHRALPAVPARRSRGLDVLRDRAAVGDAVDARQREPDPQDRASRASSSRSRSSARTLVSFARHARCCCSCSTRSSCRGCARPSCSRSRSPLCVVGLVAGLALAVASLNVVFRDIEFIVAALLVPWFFLTPMIYPLSVRRARRATHGDRR